MIYLYEGLYFQEEIGMNRNFVLCCLGLLFCLMITVCPQVQAIGHDVQILPGGFYPESISIETGDFIQFYNYAGMPVTVFQTSGPCSYWGYTFPYPGNYSVYFPCSAGMEIAYCPEAASMLYIEITVPVPTPTPDMTIPSTSPFGIGLTLILMGLALSMTWLKRRV